LSADLLIAMMIVIFGGALSGIAGFGFALIVVPPLLFIYNPPTVTALAILLTICTRWVILVDSWREIRWRTLWALMPGALVGVVFGVYLIQALDPAYIKLIAGLVVIFTSLTMILGWTVRGAHSPIATAVAGVASGTFNTTVGMAGPPVVFLFTTRNYSVQAFRASMTMYFYLISVTGILALVERGVVGSSQLRIALALLPASIIGTVIGQVLVRRFSVASFRRVTLALLFLTGAVGVVTALEELF
jgi:uncharacterized protein